MGENRQQKELLSNAKSIDWDNYKLSDIYHFGNTGVNVKNDEIEQKDTSMESHSSVEAGLSNQSKNISPLSSFLHDQDQEKAFFPTTKNKMLDSTTGDHVVDQILSQVSKKMTI